MITIELSNRLYYPMANFLPIVALLLTNWQLTEAVTNERDQKFYFPKYVPEVFYDNKVLPEDVEVSVYVVKAQTQRVYFLVEKEGRPLSLTVTPCSQPVRWKLSSRKFPLPNKKDSLQNHVPEKEDTTPIASYSGRDRKTYSKSRTSAGLYVLELDSRDADTSVRIYVTTRPELNTRYPQLPSDPRVSILKVRRNKVLLAWKASPTEGNPTQTISYCTVQNQVQNHHSMCSVKAQLQGEPSPTHPPSSGFGFSWEKSKKKHGTPKSRGLSDTGNKNATVVCVGRKTWHMFRNLQKGMQYYFDVFVVNTQTNASSSYIGVQVTTKQSKSASRLRDSFLSTITLDSKNDYSVMVKYPVFSNTKKLWIFVQSCTGPGPITLQVNKDGREVASFDVMDTKTLSLVPTSNGTYQFTVKSALHSPRKARMWIGKKYHKLPFPVLPEDKSVKVFDTLTTCDSVTLAWHTTVDEKVKYCIYKQTVKAGFMRLFSSPQNSCEEPETNKEGSERIVCRRYHRFSRRRFNNVIMQKIRDLTPAQTYLFSVQVTKQRAKTLSYEQVWVTTAANCSSSPKGKR